MRDLYSKLGLRTGATAQQIQEAINTCRDARLRTDAEAVLLNAGRKKTYDQVHSVLADIGQLRAKLGLTHSENWCGPEAQDFSSESWNPTSAADAFSKKLKRYNGRAKAKSALRSTLEFVAPFVVLAMVAGGFMYYDSTADKSPSSSTSQRAPQYTLADLEQPAQGAPAQSGQQYPNEPEFNEPPLPLPATGAVSNYTGQTGEAPLEIKTSPGANYFVRLEETNSGRNIIGIFVRGGTTVSVEVPLGTYLLKYAAGQTWYGETHKFGPDTAYSKAETPFRFYVDGQRISGYTVTLYQVRDGNLPTSRLRPEDF